MENESVYQNAPSPVAAASASPVKRVQTQSQSHQTLQAASPKVNVVQSTYQTLRAASPKVNVVQSTYQTIQVKSPVQAQNPYGLQSPQADVLGRRSPGNNRGESRASGSASGSDFGSIEQSSSANGGAAARADRDRRVSKKPRVSVVKPKNVNIRDAREVLGARDEALEARLQAQMAEMEKKEELAQQNQEAKAALARQKTIAYAEKGENYLNKINRAKNQLEEEMRQKEAQYAEKEALIEERKAAVERERLRAIQEKKNRRMSMLQRGQDALKQQEMERQKSMLNRLDTRQKTLIGKGAASASVSRIPTVARNNR